MFKICLSVLTLTLLFSCSYDPSYSNEIEASAWENEISALNENELKLIDSLTSLGYEVKLSHGIIDRRTKGLNYQFVLHDDTLLIDSSNYQSFILLREKLMKNLCLRIIEDSLIYNLDKLEFSFNYKVDKSVVFMKGSDEGKGFKPTRFFDKKDIENLYGFRVIKDSNSMYKRIAI